jgi:hypothetical protein
MKHSGKLNKATFKKCFEVYFFHSISQLIIGKYATLSSEEGECTLNRQKTACAGVKRMQFMLCKLCANLLPCVDQYKQITTER